MVENLSGIYYKSRGVLEIKEGDKLLKAVQTNGEDDWFSLHYKKMEYDLNLYEDKLGCYGTEKVGKNTYQTGEFINEIPVSII